MSWGEQFLNLAELWPEAMLLLEAEGNVLAANRAFQQLVRLPAQRCVGERLQDLAEAPGGTDAYIRACARTRQPLPGSLDFRLPDGGIVSCRAYGSLLRPREESDAALVLLRLTSKVGAAQHFLVMNEQIEALSKEVRQRKQAQAQLARALEEKEVLLREIHHRVKNNMQIIAGFLDLHAIQVEDPAARQVLQEARNRIYVMAQVHQRLYASEGLQQVELGPLLKELAERVVHSYARAGQDVSLHLNVGHVPASLDTALAFGLLVHELVSNAVEHAFPDGRAGTVEVDLMGPDGQGKHILRVSDNGVGMPSGFDPPKVQSMGMQLIHALARQIDGAVVYDSRGGTTVTIAFGG